MRLGPQNLTLSAMVSQQLAEHWRVRLAFWRQRLVEGRPRPWIARAYVRVLTFLLAQYGATSDEQTSEDAAVEHPQSAMRLTVAVPELCGKPARRDVELRSVLEAVHSKVPAAPPGPLTAGLPPDEWIVVASYYNPQLVDRLVARLQDAGIECHSKPFRRQIQVLIHLGNLDRARPIIAGFELVARDSWGYRRQFINSFAAGGAMIGILLGLVIAAIFGGSGTEIAIVGLVLGGIFAPFGVVIGFLAGMIADG